MFDSISHADTRAAADRICRFQSGVDEIDLEALDIDRFISSKAFWG